LRRGLKRRVCGQKRCSKPENRAYFELIYRNYKDIARSDPEHRRSKSYSDPSDPLVHAELILIHPFRDGNGRCARLLATLMGLQAGLPALDFGGIRGETKRRYIGAVHAAMDRDYRPMTATFRGVIARSLRTQVTASSARDRS